MILCWNKQTGHSSITGEAKVSWEDQDCWTFFGKRWICRQAALGQQGNDKYVRRLGRRWFNIEIKANTGEEEYIETRTEKGADSEQLNISTWI